MKVKLKAECKFTIRSEHGREVDAGGIEAETGWFEHHRTEDMIEAVLSAIVDSSPGLDSDKLEEIAEVAREEE